MIAVVRLRGKVGLKKEFEDTMGMLNLTRVNHCTLVQETSSYKGMLNKVRDYCTYGVITDDTIIVLVSKRGRLAGDERLNDKQVKDVITGLKNGKSLKELGIKPLFRLKPPSKGLKSKKYHYPKGDLGERDKMDDLLGRMI